MSHSLVFSFPRGSGGPISQIHNPLSLYGRPSDCCPLPHPEWSHWAQSSREEGM